jgi:hypothetical protein
VIATSRRPVDRKSGLRKEISKCCQWISFESALAVTEFAEDPV